MEHDFPSAEIQEHAFESVMWKRLAGVTTSTATPAEESMANVRANIGRPLPWFHEHYPVKDEDRVLGKRIALVGGGPSLRETVAELMDFRTIIACGSVHDWLQDHCPRIPMYTAVCDPDPVMANYLRRPNKDTTYMVSSHANKAVFDALEGQNVMMWHCWPVGAGDQTAKDFLDEHTPGWVSIGGGCTVGLRALSMALMMGYSEIHFFGFDSCLGMTDDQHHAYPFTDETKEFIGDIYEVKIGMGPSFPKPREYRVAGYQLAQADHYKQMLMAFGHVFKPVFHGPGLMADLQQMIDAEAKRLTEEMAA